MKGETSAYSCAARLCDKNVTGDLGFPIVVVGFSVNTWPGVILFLWKAEGQASPSSVAAQRGGVQSPA